MWFHYRGAGGNRAVRVERRGEHYVVHLGGRLREVIIRRAAGPALDLLVDGRPLRALVAAEGDRRAVKLGDGDALSFDRVDAGSDEGVEVRIEPRASAPGDAPAAGRPAPDLPEAVTASMDGQIAAVMVKPGDVVEAGATLVVLEAMKMEMRLVAPRRALVRHVACQTGDVVRRGRLLVQLEAA